MRKTKDRNVNVPTSIQIVAPADIFFKLYLVSSHIFFQSAAESSELATLMAPLASATATESRALILERAASTAALAFLDAGDEPVISCTEGSDPSLPLSASMTCAVDIL